MEIVIHAAQVANPADCLIRLYGWVPIYSTADKVFFDGAVMTLRVAESNEKEGRR